MGIQGLGGSLANRHRQSVGRNLMLVGALVFGCCMAVVLASFSFSQAKEEAPKQRLEVTLGQKLEIPKPTPVAPAEERVEVLVPIKEIKNGEFLTPSMFKLQQTPRYLAGPNSVTSLSEIEGRFAAGDMAADTPINRGLISNLQAANDLIAKIPVGYRGVSIQTDPITSVEGWARPGAAVDVYWLGMFNGQQASQVIVQNARVLSSERSTRPQADPTNLPPSTVTLMVSEKEAVRIALASSEGKLVLQLRGANDSAKTSSLDGIKRLQDVFDGGTSEKVEGVVRVPGRGGEVEEMVLIDGQIRRK
ncbi:MAG: Flp pilus assembly protein CpaB [Proteobacteria bacterium]|nr:Flp pilus assembly protein CpaB [Pseudomonadota bacterium]